MMSLEEKLARDIAWLWPSGRPPKGKRKATYWNEISESARQNYRCDARRFVYLLTKLPPDAVDWAFDIAKIPAPKRPPTPTGE